MLCPSLPLKQGCRRLDGEATEYWLYTQCGFMLITKIIITPGDCPGQRQKQEINDNKDVSVPQHVSPGFML